MGAVHLLQVTFFDGTNAFMRERQSERNFPLDNKSAEFGEYIPAQSTLTDTMKFGFSLTESEHAAMLSNTKGNGLSVALIVSVSYKDVFKKEIREEYGFLAEASAGGWFSLKPFPIWIFETQDEMLRRHDEGQSQA